MFSNSKFNGNISEWDVSNVTNMSGMFFRSKFNQDISNWKLNINCIVDKMFSESSYTYQHPSYDFGPDHQKGPPHLDIDFLIDTNRSVITENADKFLKTIGADFFDDKSLIERIKRSLVKAKKIGKKSALGEVFLVNHKNKKYVFKIMRLCEDDKSQIDVDMCNNSKGGDLIFKIPNSYENKYIWLAPNYLTENIIGILIRDITKKYTPCFLDLYGFQYERSKKLYIAQVNV